MKPTRQIEPIDGVIRITGWPGCLADKDVADAVKRATYEGYEQEQGSRTGIYRIR